MEGDLAEFAETAALERGHAVQPHGQAMISDYKSLIKLTPNMITRTKE